MLIATDVLLWHNFSFGCDLVVRVAGTKKKSINTK